MKGREQMRPSCSADAAKFRYTPNQRLYFLADFDVFSAGAER
jgi:hypothetical protein